MCYLKQIGLVLIIALRMSALAGAQSSSMLLEKGIYTEETLGNLSEAIKIYQQVVADMDAGRPTAALALYRLGMCYQKSGQQEEAQATFAKLAKLYPEQRDLLSKIPAPAPKELNLGPAPWIDGEVLQFSISGKNGPPVALRVYQVESAQEGGKNVWKFQSMMLTLEESQFSTVLVEAKNLVPISSRQRSTFTEVSQAKYTLDRVEYSTLADGAVVKRQVALDRTVYDDEEIMQLMRRLPLSEKFQVTVPAVSPDGQAVTDLTIEVGAQERITVPAGIFDCHKVILRSGDSRRQENYWFSTDSHVYPVKATNILGDADLELLSVTTRQENQPAYFDDRELGIKLSAPAGWHLYRSPSTVHSMIHIAGPEGDENGDIQVSDLPKDRGEKPSPAKLADEYAGTIKKTYKAFAVRPESRETITVSGLPAARYLADFKALVTGDETVEYHVVFLTEAKRYDISLKADKNSFNDMRSVFDYIVSSFKLE